jgi:transcriptional regulator with XRE-family HTH domain
MADEHAHSGQRVVVTTSSQISRDTALAFALRLRAAREAAGLTQEVVAARARLSRNHYQLLESGLSDRTRKHPANPRLSTILDVASALECEAADLVSELPHSVL